MLAAARRWGGGADERPFLPRAFSVLRAQRRPPRVHARGRRARHRAPVRARARRRPARDRPARASASPTRPTTAARCSAGAGWAPRRWPSGRTSCWRAASRRPALLGFRDADHAPGATLLHNARVATDDGSHGHHGLVTDLLADELDAGPPAVVYACGPPPMLEAVRALCAARDVPCQLALESGMACGFGACFGCVVRPARRRLPAPVRRRAGPRRRPAGGGAGALTAAGSTSAACAWRTRSSTARAPSTPSPRAGPSATRCSSTSPSRPSSPRRSRWRRATATRRRGSTRPRPA